MGICGEQCPEVVSAVKAGISLMEIGSRVVAACYDRPFSCRDNGPDKNNGRCTVEPGTRMVLRAVVDVAVNPIDVPVMREQ